MARSGQKTDLRHQLRGRGVRPTLAQPADLMAASSRVRLIPDTMLARRLRGFLDGGYAFDVDIRPMSEGSSYYFYWSYRDENEGRHEYKRDLAVRIASALMRESPFGGSLQLFDSGEPGVPPTDSWRIEGTFTRADIIPVQIDESCITNIMFDGQPLGSLPEQAAHDLRRRTERGVRFAPHVVLENDSLVVVFETVP